MNNQMNATDFTFKYKTEEYNKIYSFLNSHDFSLVDIQLFIALVGSNNECSITMNEDDGSYAHTFSRTNYTRHTPEMERNFGLITILNNPQSSYDELLNKKAFVKNSTGEKFLDLPNVSEFYTSFLGGIGILNNLIYNYSSQEEDIFDSLYEYLTEDENIKVMTEVAEQVKKDTQ